MGNEQQDSEIAIVCALEVERRWLRRFCGRGTPEIHCSGPGPDNMRRWLKAHQPRRLIVAGLAGSLNSRARAGSAWIVDEVIDWRCGDRWRSNVPADLANRSCSIVSVDTVISTRAERAQLSQSSGADLVDMESAAAARWASDAGVPWTIVRGVSDDGQDAKLPSDSADWIDDHGNTRLRSVAGAVLRRPSLVKELLVLRHHSRRAMMQVSTLVHLLADAGQGRQVGIPPRSRLGSSRS